MPVTHSHFTVPLDRELRKQLNELAAEQDRSAAAVARQAIRAAVAVSRRPADTRLKNGDRLPDRKVPVPK